MRVLIVQANENLARVWSRHLERMGAVVEIALSASAAQNHIAQSRFDVIVLDLVLGQGSAIAVADVAHYRQPEANVVFVTNTSFFSDGSIFAHCSNARAFIQTDTPARDVAAIVHHYGSAASHDHAAESTATPG